jgi:hypothetical protein
VHDDGDKTEAELSGLKARGSNGDSGFFICAVALSLAGSAPYLPNRKEISTAAGLGVW